MELSIPALEHLESYKAALEKSWSPDNMRPEAAQEQLQKIAEDPLKFLSLMTDQEAAGGPVQLQDGSFVPRLPGFRRWMWDGELIGRYPKHGAIVASETLKYRLKINRS